MNLPVRSLKLIAMAGVTLFIVKFIAAIVVIGFGFYEFFSVSLQLQFLALFNPQLMLIPIGILLKCMGLAIELFLAGALEVWIAMLVIGEKTLKAVFEYVKK